MTLSSAYATEHPTWVLRPPAFSHWRRTSTYSRPVLSARRNATNDDGDRLGYFFA